MTPLDDAHAAMTAAPDDDAARLRYFGRLADGMLFLLLEDEVATDSKGRTLRPRVFALEDGPVVLAFDLEERLAEAVGAAAPYAELPGRVIAAQLAGQGVALGVNLGVAESAFLVPPDALSWLASTLDAAPSQTEARVAQYLAPGGLPDALLAALDTRLARAGALAARAHLVGVRYDDGRRGHLLAIVGAGPGAQPALARAVAEALTFSGVEAGELDVGFLAEADPALARLTRVALTFDLPQATVAPIAAPSPPGSDPQRPPKLR